MRKIFFDIETQNTFSDVGRRDPVLLDIAVVSIFDSETGKFSSFTIDELDGLWPILERSQMLVGFNSDHFDFPLLNKYYPGDLYGLKSLDLMKEIQESFGRRIGLGVLAEATLGEKKSADGLQAIAWWRNGEIEKIKSYCEQDVRVTKNLYDYIVEHGHVKIPDILTGQVQVVAVDCSLWDEPEGSGMTIGLGF
jgi:DEAD/DEAH box helicase domain-containing protein